MRILITGSRKFTDEDTVAGAIMGVADVNNPPVIVHGGAKGADSLAAEVAERSGFVQEVHPADWNGPHKRGAGLIRNQEMVDLGADVVLAFWKIGAENKGTADCVGRATKAGLQVVNITGF